MNWNITIIHFHLNLFRSIESPNVWNLRKYITTLRKQIIYLDITEPFNVFNMFTKITTYSPEKGTSNSKTVGNGLDRSEQTLIWRNGQDRSLSRRRKRCAWSAGYVTLCVVGAAHSGTTRTSWPYGVTRHVDYTLSVAKVSKADLMRHLSQRERHGSPFGGAVKNEVFDWEGKRSRHAVTLRRNTSHHALLIINS